MVDPRDEVLNTEISTVVQAEEVPPAQAGKPLGIGGWICIAWLVAVVAVSFIAPYLQAPPIDTGGRASACGDGSGLPIYDPFNCKDLAAKSAQRRGDGADGAVPHVVGVDGGGADVFSQVLVGGRTTVLIALVSIAGGVLIGATLGLMGGFFRGRGDLFITGAFDVMISFPALILALLIVTVVAADDSAKRIPGIIFALVIVITPVIGRISRASTLSWSEREFVMAARALGARPFRIITREVLPNVAPAIMSIAMLGFGIVIVAEASLAIVGVGVPPETASWGSVIARGAADFRNFPHMVFFPSVLIVITVCAINFLGDSLRRKFEVKESAL